MIVLIATTAALAMAAPTPALGPGSVTAARGAGSRQAAADSATIQPWTTNPEMTAIFDADQADRAAGAKIDWSVVGPRDAERRRRTKALLDAGKLQSGTDFWHAAFIFQHGEGDDYLLAHALAMIAIARGRPDATWIAAATLDRYLQAHDLQQVYGTQFVTMNGKTTQEPYNRTLISDALRTASGVPTQAEQEKQRQQFEKEFGAVTSDPPRN